MRLIRSVAPLVFAALPFVAGALGAQQQADSTDAHRRRATASADSFPWRDSVRYGGGPSVGAPPSDFTGKTPPIHWCLTTVSPAPGDLSRRGETWSNTSRGWLKQVLSDPTDWGDGWRKVLGGAPKLAAQDSIIELTDEAACQKIAEVVNRQLLGWEVGPPVVVLRIGDLLIAYPSNARMGEFGLAVGMTLDYRIRAVAMW